ncbi:unnamed protein product, partial [Mesorhabditis belari]|uniref:Uncharacterized protein n=1 Tax=Mesorhabditis belari TaxID=2138241 RepID=A0AAF3EXJ2_9BILA
MEAQEIRSSETRLDVAVLPDVPFLRLEPENFGLAIDVLTTSFWQDKCIRDRRGLAITARNLSFDDQVLLNFASPNFMLSDVTACTFAGIASFLNEWGAGIREVTKIRLWVRSDLNIREFFAMLSWNVKNSLGKKLHLWIEQEEAKEFCFEMLEDYDNDYLGYS